MLLVGRNELVEEAYIVLREHTQVGYLMKQLDVPTDTGATSHSQSQAQRWTSLATFVAVRAAVSASTLVG